MARQTGLVENDDVVQAVPAKSADDPFDVSALPGRAWGREHLFDAHGLDLLDRVLTEDAVPVTEQIAGCAVPGEGLPELVRSPFGRGMSCDGKVEKATTLVHQHQEHVQNLKTDRRYREEVHRNQTLYMIFQEGSPGLRRWPPATDHVFTHAGFADINAQLEQFAMDPWSAPEWILSAHSADQIANLYRHGRTPGLAPSNFPPPKQAKALPVPADHRGWLDEEKTGFPVPPDLAKPGPEESIGWGELRPLHRALQNAELMAEGEDLQLQRRTAPEGGKNRGEKCREYRAEKESKEDRQFPIYQSHRNLRDRQSITPISPLMVRDNM
jgi:hypothetical protein